jgi:hypothetical protein
MIITLSTEQQAKLLEWAGSSTQAHLEADCLPQGYTLHIDVGGPFPDVAWAVSGPRRLELGEVSVQLS